MAEIERLIAADHAAVGRLLLEAYADYAARMGSEWPRARRWCSCSVLGVAISPPTSPEATPRRSFMDGAEGQDDAAATTNARRVFKLKV